MTAVLDRCPRCTAFVCAEPARVGTVGCAICDLTFVASQIHVEKLRMYWATLPYALQHKIEHALGYDRLYRNHYCAPVGGIDCEDWKWLSNANLARLGRISDGMHTWHVTDAGIALYKAVRGIS